MSIDPTRIYEDPDGVLELLAAPIALGIAANTQIIAAIAGKKIRVMGWVAQSIGATAGSFQFRSNSGGAFIHGAIFAPPSTNGDTNDKPIVPSGYCKTSTGHGLFVDVTVAPINLTVYYVTYTPTA